MPFFKKYNNKKVAIIGYTDNTGEKFYNLSLSLKRAKAVYEYLITRGVAKERLSFKGKGELDPVASNDTEEGQAANRRVEFVMEDTQEEKEDKAKRRR